MQVDDFLKKEADRLRTCWAAFLAPLKECRLPLPEVYREAFERLAEEPPENQRHLLAELLRDTREILSWLLSQGEIKEIITGKGRLAELEALLNRLRELEDQVYYLREELLRDDLTKLWNRRALSIFFPQIVKEICQGKQLYILVFMDLCDLKMINDRYGHTVGDQVLIQMAKRLQAFTKRVDVPARLGGDEFVLLLATHSLEKAKPFLQEFVSEPLIFRCQQEAIEIYLACGATDILGEDTLESCLHRADLAMYKHKTQLKAWLQEGQKGPFPEPVLFRALSKDL